MNPDNPTEIEDAGRGGRMAAYARAQTARTIRAVGLDTPPAGGESIPGYVLLRQISSGGQGVVYEAIQSATKRRVAIKIIREWLGTGSRQRARFERELEVLGQLRHPNIVTVHDGGTTATGRLFLVMDFVDGPPIDIYCAKHQVPVRDILKLIVKVCHALNSAHMQGIVHRDLKPNNICVGSDGEPKVLDFGLAKVLEQGLIGTRTAETLIGDFVGSLAWASPEQAEGAQDQVDIRTDVHALGVLLFHALTGEFPYQVMAAMPQVLANISSAEPVRPSRLRPELDDDLDTIILKCLSKDRARRYQTAGELARDLEHYLNNEPIEAKRDSTIYVVRRLVRRHWLLSSAVGAGMIALMVFAATVTVLLERARQAEAHSKGMLHRLQTTNSTVVDKLAPLLAKLPGGSPARQELLEATLESFGGLADYDTGDPILRGQRADALVQLSDIAVAAGQRDEAMRLRREIVTIREELVRENPADPGLAAKLATDYVRVGNLLDGANDVLEQLRLYERAFEIDKKLVEQYPNNIKFIDDLAFSYERLAGLANNAGDYAKAEAMFGKQHELALSLVKLAPNRPGSHWALLCSLGQVAALREQRGDWAGWATLQAEAMGVAQRLLEFDAEKPEHLKAIVSTAGSVAYCQARAFLPGSAVETLLEVEPHIRRLVELDPSNHDRQRDLAGYYLRLSGVHHIKGDISNTERFASLALDTLHALPANASEQPDQLRLLLTASSWLATVAYERGHHDPQGAFEKEAINAANALELKQPRDITTLHILAAFWTACDTPGLCDPVRGELLVRRGIELSGGAFPRPFHTLALALYAQGRMREAHVAANQALALCPADTSGFCVELEFLVMSFPEQAPQEP